MAEKNLFSANAFAEASGIDRRTVGKRLEGMTPAKVQGRASLYTLADLLKACAVDLARVYLPGHQAQPAEGETLEEAKTRKEAALASLHELELAEKTGRLLDAEKVTEWWVRMITNAKTKILAIPTKAAPLVIGCKSPAQAKDVLEQHIHEALTELSATNPETITEAQ